MSHKKNLLIQIADDLEKMETVIEDAKKPFRAVIAEQRATIVRLQLELDQARLAMLPKPTDEIYNAWGGE